MQAELATRAEHTKFYCYTRFDNCGLRMRLECRERFPRHRLQRKPPVIDPVMHHGTCLTHMTWCMWGSLTRDGGKRRSRHSRRMRNLQLCVSGKRPMVCPYSISFCQWRFDFDVVILWSDVEDRAENVVPRKDSRKNPNLEKSRLSITYFVKSLGMFSQSAVQHFQNIWQSKWVLWTKEIWGHLSLRWDECGRIYNISTVL